MSIEEVADAVRAVYAGQSLISPSLASKLLNEFEGQVGTIKESLLGAGPKLSEREVEILKMVALGMGNHDVAERLGMSENTVRNHVANILVKLQLRAQIETAT